MRHLFTFTVSLFLSATMAQAKVDLRPRSQKVEDPGSATPLLYKDSKELDRLKPAEKSSAVTSTCTDSSGVTIKKGSAGYETCLNNVNKSKNTNVNEKNPNSLGFTIGN